MLGRRKDGDAETHLFAVLIGDDVAFGCTRVGAEHDAVLEETSDDGCAGARRLWQRQSSLCQKVIACICVMIIIWHRDIASVLTVSSLRNRSQTVCTRCPSPSLSVSMSMRASRAEMCCLAVAHTRRPRETGPVALLGLVDEPRTASIAHHHPHPQRRRVCILPHNEHAHSDNGRLEQDSIEFLQHGHRPVGQQVCKGLQLEPAGHSRTLRQHCT